MCNICVQPKLLGCINPTKCTPHLTSTQRSPVSQHLLGKTLTLLFPRCPVAWLALRQGYGERGKAGRDSHRRFTPRLVHQEMGFRPDRRHFLWTVSSRVSPAPASCRDQFFNIISLSNESRCRWFDFPYACFGRGATPVFLKTTGAYCTDCACSSYKI